MKNKWMTFAGALVSLSVLGTFTAPSLMAQARPALVQDTDQAARAPFEVTMQVQFNNFQLVPVSIPAGYRLVIDYVSIVGVATTSGAYIEPVINLIPSVSGGQPASFLFTPEVSKIVPAEFLHSEKVAITADSLMVQGAYNGSAPRSYNFFLSISGHLIKL